MILMNAFFLICIIALVSNTFSNVNNLKPNFQASLHLAFVFSTVQLSSLFEVSLTFYVSKLSIGVNCYFAFYVPKLRPPRSR